MKMVLVLKEHKNILYISMQYNIQEFHISRGFKMGMKMMQYNDIEKEINGRKQFDDRVYEQNESDLLEKFEELKQELNIQLLSKIT
tara:strand:- start:1427 stop:1684 length:258 start_codon:yes stop_codon:yes gene_type:complete